MGLFSCSGSTAAVVESPSTVGDGPGEARVGMMATGARWVDTPGVGSVLVGDLRQAAFDGSEVVSCGRGTLELGREH